MTIGREDILLTTSVVEIWENSGNNDVDWGEERKPTAFQTT